MGFTSSRFCKILASDQCRFGCLGDSFLNLASSTPSPSADSASLHFPLAGPGGFKGGEHLGALDTLYESGWLKAELKLRTRYFASLPRGTTMFARLRLGNGD